MEYLTRWRMTLAASRIQSLAWLAPVLVSNLRVHSVQPSSGSGVVLRASTCASTGWKP